MTKTLFRADSSASVGLGHMKRDLVYASRLVDANISFASFENCLDLPYACHQLSTEDINELIKLCQNLKIEHLIIDHYSISYEDEKKLKENLDIKLSVFDDTYEKHYCDEIINHNISANASKYTLEHFTKLSIIDPLIRNEFKQIKMRNRKNKTGEILICMGGVDSKNLTQSIVNICQSSHSFCINVVTSSINKNLHNLKKIKNINLYIDTTEMAKLMDRSDLAILTPSVIVHEALFMKLPFIAIKTASNQDDIYNYLLGNRFKTLDSFDEEKLKLALEEIIKKKE